MTKSRMKGWVRLGIVFSTLFIVTFHSFVAYEYIEVKDKLALSNLNTKEDSESEWQITGQEGTFISCSINTPPITCTIKKKSYFLVLLAPLVVLWLLLPIFLWAFYWVRAGFKDAA